MITITTVVGAVGFGFGVCFATACLTFAVLWDEYREKRAARKVRKSAWEKGMHDWDSLDQVWSVDNE